MSCVTRHLHVLRREVFKVLSYASHLSSFLPSHLPTPPCLQLVTLSYFDLHTKYQMVSKYVVRHKCYTHSCDRLVFPSIFWSVFILGKFDVVAWFSSQTGWFQFLSVFSVVHCFLCSNGTNKLNDVFKKKVLL